jgi:double-stranded uracil-DNA glycosylase
VARVQSFAPVIGERPRILILGSMPGVASLDAVQYYAHPRNAFWPIMAELFRIDASVDYAQRIAQISEAPVILWDTLRRCYRPGSLDASIARDSVEANDIPALLEEYSGVRVVACNGASSANYFRKLVSARISPSIELLQMPSTSPANAAMNFEQKLAAWRRLLEFI